jgi:membrane associated rhomboid family serine protease
MYSYFFGGPATKTVKTLIIVNIAVFLVQFVFRLVHGWQLPPPTPFDAFFGLVPTYITNKLMLWQFVTYMFLHSTNPPFFHIVFNMLTLFMFGNELERYWGRRFFLKYYFITGIAAGFCSWLVSINGRSVIVGASGAIYGLLLAYGLLYPNRIIYLNFLLPIKVRWFVLIFGCITLLNSLIGTDEGIASIAHLGGMGFGYLYLRGRGWNDKYRQFREHQQRERLKQQFEVYYGDVRRKIESDKKKGPTIH